MRIGLTLTPRWFYRQQNAQAAPVLHLCSSEQNAWGKLAEWRPIGALLSRNIVRDMYHLKLGI